MAVVRMSMAAQPWLAHPLLTSTLSSAGTDGFAQEVITARRIRSGEKAGKIVPRAVELLITAMRPDWTLPAHPLRMGNGLVVEVGRRAESGAAQVFDILPTPHHPLPSRPWPMLLRLQLSWHTHQVPSLDDLAPTARSDTTMWELVLVGQVFPAFAALAKEFVERETADQSLAQDACDCYSDIVLIGVALAKSGGEWAPDLDKEKVVDLMKALETRLPKRWVFPTLTSFAALTTTEGQEDDGRFPRLQYLSKALQSKSLGGFDKCPEVLSQSSEEHGQYLNLVGRNASLFHKSEIESEKERQKFTTKLHAARNHLSDVYICDTSAADDDEFSLSQHPSRGIKELANCLYGLLERHWKCRCPQLHSGASLAVGREARLSLIRHRQLAPKVAVMEATAQSYRPAKFEILLPVTKHGVQWKVVNVEVKTQRYDEACPKVHYLSFSPRTLLGSSPLLIARSSQYSMRNGSRSPLGR